MLTIAPGIEQKLMKLHYENTDALRDQILMTYRKRGSLVNVTEQFLPTYEQLLKTNNISYKIGPNYEPKQLGT